jgi:hypothetical protein
LTWLFTLPPRSAANVGRLFDGVVSGQWGGVTLPAGQQRVLDRIEVDLEGCEPRLRSMFAIFARLTRDDEAPRTESLRPRARLAVPARSVITLTLLLGLVAVSVFMAVTGSTTHTCQPAPGVHGAGQAATCQSTQQAPGRG